MKHSKFAEILHVLIFLLLRRFASLDIQNLKKIRTGYFLIIALPLGGREKHFQVGSNFAQLLVPMSHTWATFHHWPSELKSETYPLWYNSPIKIYLPTYTKILNQRIC